MRFLLIAPVPFIVTPIILKHIGSSGYGAWAVLMAIMSLSTLADLGLVGTLSKHVSEYVARNDFPSLNRLFATGFILFLATAGTLAVAILVASRFLIKALFHGSGTSNRELVELFRYVAAIIMINIMILLFSSLTSGLQRLDVTNLLSSLNVIMAGSLSIVFLRLSWGLRGLLWANIIAGTVTLIAYALLARKLVPMLKPSWTDFDAGEVRSIFCFSLQLYITQMAVIIHTQVEKIYLSWFVGIAAAGAFDIASDSALKIRSGPGLLLTPMMPAASELAALEDGNRLKELYYRSSKYLAMVGVPVVLLALLISRRFFDLWLGAKFEFIIPAFRALLVVNYFNLMTGPGYLILVGRGILRPGVYSAGVGICINVVVSFFLIYKYGFAGAVMGTSMSLVTASAFFIWLFHRETGYPFRPLIERAYGKPIVASSAIIGVLYFVVDLSHHSWPGLSLLSLAFAATYFFVLVITRFFDSWDIANLERFIPLARFLRRSATIA